jgi:hypothetical protein
MAIRIIGPGNQDYIINMVKAELNKDRKPGSEKTLTTDAVIQTMEGGICYMLSMEWIREKILKDNNQVQQFNVIGFNEKDYVKNNLAHYVQIANNYYVYGQDTDMRVNVSQFYRIPLTDDLSDFQKINELFVELCSANKLDGSTTYIKTTSDYLEECVKNIESGYFLLGFSASENNSGFGHETAFAKKKDGTILFYDPNFGVMEADEFKDVIGFLEKTYFNVANLEFYDLCEVKMSNTEK